MSFGLDWHLSARQLHKRMSTPENIRNVVVVGAGTMGPGIAATFARHGYVTTLSDIDTKQIDKARRSVDFVFRQARRRGSRRET